MAKTDELSLLARRFKEFRTTIGLSQVQLSKEFGKDQPTIARYENGSYEIPMDMIKYLQRKHSLNVKWYFEGVGNPILKSEEKPKANLVTDIAILKENDDILLHEIKFLKKEFKKLHAELFELKQKVQSGDFAGTK